MPGVQDIYALRHKVLVEGKSQRQVAREMGLARDTVRRYLATPLPEPRKRKRSRPVLEQVRPQLEQLSRGVVGAHHGEAAHHGPEAAAGAARGSSSTTSWRRTTFCASPGEEMERTGVEVAPAGLARAASGDGGSARAGLACHRWRTTRATGDECPVEDDVAQRAAVTAAPQGLSSPA